MAEREGINESLPNLSPEQLAALTTSISPILLAAFQSVSGDSLAFVFGRYLEQFLNILRLVTACREGQIEAALVGDILRSSVVYAHASLEETIREIARRRIDLWPQSLLDDVPFTVGKQRKNKISLGDLLPFVDKTVRQTIQDAATEWLNSLSFTSLAKILSFLERIDIDVRKILAENPDVFGTDPNEYLRPVSQLIERRHRIVHYQDYEQGIFSRGAIDLPEVTTMMATVWCVNTVIIVEEMRRHPNWKKPIEALIEILVLAAPTFATSDTPLIKALDAIKAGSSWPYLNEEGAGETSERPTP